MSIRTETHTQLGNFLCACGSDLAAKVRINRTPEQVLDKAIENLDAHLQQCNHSHGVMLALQLKRALYFKMRDLAQVRPDLLKNHDKLRIAGMLAANEIMQELNEVEIKEISPQAVGEE